MAVLIVAIIGKIRKIILLSLLSKDNVLVKEWKDMSDIHKKKPIKSTQHVLRCLQGKSKTAGGYIWKYKE